MKRLSSRKGSLRRRESEAKQNYKENWKE